MSDVPQTHDPLTVAEIEVYLALASVTAGALDPDTIGPRLQTALDAIRRAHEDRRGMTRRAADSGFPHGDDSA